METVRLGTNSRGTEKEGARLGGTCKGGPAEVEALVETMIETEIEGVRPPVAKTLETTYTYLG